ncbi:hypothetical protein [Nocardioides renjunii]|uniref:hypothetical protein n=1 Tax=Nocardioides renjunii TaxID=3095075 RepID=UPI002AFE68EB|nr:hypothetical protein [Nocardioides sp. S-34]WQQ21577.1 hypothetical protein SHK17_16990 [Nocardioides sp. S-34]
MVQLTARRRLGTVSAVLAGGTGVLAVALGVGLVLEADSAFGRAWASAFIVFGVVSLIGAVVGTRPPEPGSPTGRAVGLATFVLLGTWAAVTAVVGAVEESWLWGVLLGAAAAYLFGAAVRLTRSGPQPR